VDLHNPTDLNFSGSITLEAWIKPQSSTGLQDIITHGYQVGSSNAEVFLRINAGNYEVGSWNGNTASASAAMPASDLGQWVHLAGVYDSSAQKWLLYRDGVLIASSATRQGALAVNGMDWAIGARGTGTERFFQGSIDNVSIWNVARNAGQVQTDLGTNLVGNETGLVACYRLDETSGATVIDATANHNNGTLGGGNSAQMPTRVAGLVLGPTLAFTPTVTGANTVTLTVIQPDGGTSATTGSVTVTPSASIDGLPTGLVEAGTPVTLSASPTNANGELNYLWQVTDPSGQLATASGALHFNGVSQFVALGRPNDLNISGPITLEAWIKPETSGGIQDIIADGYQTSPTYAEDFLRINNGSYQVGSWNGNTSMASATMPAGDLGQWVHLAGVYNGSQWLLYRDGVLIASSGPTQGAVTANNSTWAIGASGSGLERFFQGSIDNVSIWNVGHTAAQVQADMVGAPVAQTPSQVAYYTFDEPSGLAAIDSAAHGNTGILGGVYASKAPTRVAGIVFGTTLAFTPPDEGTDTVTLQVLQPDGSAAVATGTVTVVGEPDGVDIHGQPGNTVVGQYIPAVTVAVVDANGNTVPDSTAPVTLSIKSGPHGARLGGHTTVRAVNGVATFADLTLNVAGTYTLKATGGKLAPDTSNVFTVAPADVTGDVLIQSGPTHHDANRDGQVMVRQTVTIANTSGQELSGPLAVVLQGLPAGVTPVKPTGTFQGSPYVSVLSSHATLAPGQRVSLTLRLLEPANKAAEATLGDGIEVLRGI
jgi:hypothetical protein